MDRRRQGPRLAGPIGNVDLGRSASSGAYPTTRLPLMVSLKRALVFSGAEGHIPREHARRLLVLLRLQEV